MSQFYFALGIVGCSVLLIVAATAVVNIPIYSLFLIYLKSLLLF